MAFRVELQPQAFEDLDAIAAYIQSQSSLAVAERWFNEIVDDITSLSEMPARCPVASESLALGREVRVLLHGRKNRQYRIFYIVCEDGVAKGVVKVLHIRHASRKRITGPELEERIGGSE